MLYALKILEGFLVFTSLTLGVEGATTNPPNRVCQLILAITASPSEYRQLPLAAVRKGGNHLSPRVIGYENDPAFNIGMGDAIDRSVVKLRKAKESKGISKETIVEILHEEIGKTRRQIALKAGTESAELYGVQLPNTPQDVPAAVRSGILSDSNELYGSGPHIALLDFHQRKVIDYYRPTGRHSVFYDRAKERAEIDHNSPRKLEVLIDGKKVFLPLTRFVKKRGSVEGVHPSFEEMGLMKETAYQILERAMNEPLSEPQFIQQLAMAHYLLMHGTPFMRGSPASVSALMSALIEVKLGKSLPSPKPGVEVFMEAMFRSPESFVELYRGFFE